MADEFTLYEADIVVKVDKQPAEKALEEVKKDFQNAVPEIEKQTSKIKDALKSVKDQAGKSSTLGQLLKVAQGGGAIIGISLLGKELNNVIQKTTELNQQFKEGKVDAAGLAVGIGESLPAIGGFVSAGQSIREMLTGEKAMLDNENKAIEDGNALYKLRAEMIETAKKSTEDIADRLRNSNAQLRVAQAKTPGEVKQAQEINTAEAQKANRDKALQDLKDHQAKELAADIALLRSKSKLEEDGVRQKARSSKDNEIGISGALHPEESNAAINAAGDAAVAAHQNTLNDAIKAAEAKSKQVVDNYKTGLDAQAKLDDAANKARIEKEQSTADEIDKLRQQAKEVSVTGTAKLQIKAQDFKDDLVNKGKSEPEAEKAKAEFILTEQAKIAAEARDKLASLNDTYRDTGVVTLADRIHAANAQIEDEGIKAGETAEQIKALQSASERNIRGEFAQGLNRKDKQLSEFGTTPIERLRNSDEYKAAGKPVETPELKSAGLSFKDDITSSDTDRIAAYGKQLEILVARGTLAANAVDTMKAAFAKKIEEPNSDLQIKAEKQVNLEQGQQKAQSLADALKQAREETDSLGKTGLEKQIAQYEALAEQAKALGENTAGAIEKELELQTAKNAVKDQLGQAKNAGANVGLNSIDQKTAELNRVADELQKNGQDVSELRKEISDLNATEKANLTATKISDLNDQTHDVGLNPLELAKSQAARAGEDPSKVGEATGKLLGSQLTEQVKTPFEQFKQTMDYYKTLLSQGDISQKTFLRAQQQAFTQLMQPKVSDVQSAAFEHLQTQFSGIGAGIATSRMNAADKINKSKDAQDAKKNAEKEKEKQEKALKDNNDKTADNTKAMQILNQTIDRGIVALYA